MKDLTQKETIEMNPIEPKTPSERVTIPLASARTARLPAERHPVAAPRIANLTDIPRTDHAAFRSWWLGAHSRRCCLEVLSRYGSEGFGLELELCEVAEEVMKAADVHRDAFESTRERLAGRMWSLINSLEPPDGLLSGPELAAAGVEVFDYVPA
jgi:hypothetical protein